jgi:hypothetical protein
VGGGRPGAGHDVAVFGDPNPELPSLKFTTDLKGVDVALFVIQVVSDFPEMPRSPGCLTARRASGAWS